MKPGTLKWSGTNFTANMLNGGTVAGWLEVTPDGTSPAKMHCQVGFGSTYVIEYEYNDQLDIQVGFPSRFVRKRASQSDPNHESRIQYFGIRVVTGDMKALLETDRFVNTNHVRLHELGGGIYITNHLKKLELLQSSEPSLVAERQTNASFFARVFLILSSILAIFIYLKAKQTARVGG